MASGKALDVGYRVAVDQQLTGLVEAGVRLVVVVAVPVDSVSKIIAEAEADDDEIRVECQDLVGQQVVLDGAVAGDAEVQDLCGWRSTAGRGHDERFGLRCPMPHTKLSPSTAIRRVPTGFSVVIPAPRRPRLLMFSS